MPRGRKRSHSELGGSSQSNSTVNHILGSSSTSPSNNDINSTYVDFGDPTNICSHCGAYFWDREKCKKKSKKNKPVYTLCCRSGQVSLPSLKTPPLVLANLFDTTNGPNYVHFVESIHTYNPMFGFTSMGVQVHNIINDGHGAYIFKISGQTYHLMGSLLPPEGQSPKFAQLYMYDTENEISNRMEPFLRENRSNAPRRHIVEAIKEMLDRCNPYVKAFISVRERVMMNEDDTLQIRIRSDQNRNDRQYSAPIASEIVGLVVSDLGNGTKITNLIVELRSGQLKRISSTHRGYMALNYPLLFPFGEDSFVRGIPYNLQAPSTSDIERDDVTMNEFYCYRFHVRQGESDHLFRSGRLFQQFVVDMYCCVEQARLWYIREHQKSLRADSYNNIRNAAIEEDTTKVSSSWQSSTTQNGLKLIGPRPRKPSLYSCGRTLSVGLEYHMLLSQLMDLVSKQQ